LAGLRPAGPGKPGPYEGTTSRFAPGNAGLAPTAKSGY